jgi:hypothetical protein
VKGLVYQLVVEAVRLPDWFPASPTPRPPDVEVTLTVGPSGADPFAQRLSYPGLATVAIADGSRVDIELADRVGPDAVDLLLAGPVLGVVLHQRGNLVQHASAVRHEGHALVFTGGSTWGKSTTAAALYRHGFALVADDVVPLTVSAGAVTTMPGYPASKLWPDAAEALGLDVDAMPPIGLEGEKRRLDTPRGFLTDPLPVSRIYVLATGERTAIEPLEGREAFVEIVRHSYLARYLGDAEDQRRRFEQVEAIVRTITVRRLVQSSLRDLPSLPDLIAQDLET